MNNILIINKLTELLKEYENNTSLIWKKNALSKALYNIKTHDGIIISGDYAKKNIKLIGNGIAKRIDEILSTNNLEEIKQIDNKNETNDAFNELKRISGVGNVTAKQWIEKYNILSIQDLKKAVNNNIIKLSHHCSIGLKYVFDFELKIPRNEIDNINIFFTDYFNNLDNNIIFNICGSYRRGEMCSGDIDILLSHKLNINYLKNIIIDLTNKKFLIDHITENGDKKYMGVCKTNNIARRIDIRFIDYNSYYPALIYFTGSKNFNLHIRNHALKKNLSISEYGIKNKDNDELYSFNSEEELFEFIGLDYVHPHNRRL
jgi:DNA polymerase beta